MGAQFVTSLFGLSDPAPARDWAEAERLVRFHLLEGMVVARDRAMGGGLIPAAARSELEPVYHGRGLETTLVLESADRARAALSALGIPSLVFKGAALIGEAGYPDPGARRMDDADLLVRIEDATRAVEGLVAQGFSPVTGWEAGRVDWVDAVTLHDRQAATPFAPAIDLHWRTDYHRLRFGGDQDSALWEGADLEKGRPSPATHLVCIAEHFLKHLRFVVLVHAYPDLVRIAATVHDWDRVAVLVEASRLQNGLRALLSVLARDLGAPIPQPLFDGVKGDLGLSLAPTALLGKRRVVEGRLNGLIHRGRLLGSPGALFADLQEAMFPPARWLGARYGSRGALGWARYAADIARWMAYRGRSPASPNQELFDPRARE